MNPQNKPKSLQDILKQRQQSGFVGREDQVNQFRQNLALPLEDDRRRFLFNPLLSLSENNNLSLILRL
ncbi:MAG: hypothetical protein KME52_06835 [Desmonostoc geniculatum HA4340-LM1]|jgi:hypothetical protein|nr:hypothetical protein [Desmonostoc geniculatum HA4340-LM1]